MKSTTHFFHVVVLPAIFLVFILSGPPRLKAQEDEFSAQVRLYRGHMKQLPTEYQYSVGDKLKYKVTLQTWKKKFVDEGALGFKPDTYIFIVEEQILEASGAWMKIKTAIKGRQTREVGAWGPDIAVREFEGTALVWLKNNSWCTRIEDLQTDAQDAEMISRLITEVIPQINQPLMMPKKGRGIEPHYFTRDRPGTCWVTGEGAVDYRFDMHVQVREFSLFNGFDCAVMDNVIVRREASGRLLTCGTLYFDYKNSRLIRLEYQTNSVENGDNDFRKNYETFLLRIDSE